MILVTFRAGWKPNADHVEIGGRGEGDLGSGREVVGGGVDLGVDDVAGDVERGTGDLRGGGKRGGEGRGKEGGCGLLREASGRGVQIFQISIHSFAHFAAAGPLMVAAGWR